MGVSSKLQKIRKVLQNYPEGATPKMISVESRINANTIKGLLPIMTDVKKIRRGLYKVVKGGDVPYASSGDLLDWNFHNCMLSCQTKGTKPTDIMLDLKLIQIHYVVSGSGRATLRVASDSPLNVSSLCSVFAVFSLLLGWPVNMGDVFITCIEFNKDYSNLRLDGIKCITVDSLVSQFKAYQKRAGLRVEHKTKVPLSVENVVDMLSSNPSSVDISTKMSELQKGLEAVAVATANNTRLLFEAVDHMNKGGVNPYVR